MLVSGKALAFILVMSSAFIHASWNVAARHLKGNFSILVMAHFFGALMSLPLVLFYGDFTNSLANKEMWYYAVPTVFYQAAYSAFLSAAYFFGDVGLVYPLARGTAIILATTASQILSIGVPLSHIEEGGIVTVLVGVFVLAYDAYLNLSAQPVEAGQQVYSPVIVTDDSEHGAGDVEMSKVGSIGNLDKEGDEYTTDDNSSVAFERNEKSPNTSNTSKDNSQHNNDHNPGDNIPDINTGSGNTAMQTSERAATADRSKKLFFSIGFAVCVGMCTASYSITDSFGVKVVPALTYSFILNLLSAVVFAPYMFLYRYEEVVVALTTQKRYLCVMAPAITGAYLIILFVFEIPNVNVALVVTLREFSVLIGTLLGVFVLKEQASYVKVVAVCIICTGMALLKLG